MITFKPSTRALHRALTAIGVAALLCGAGSMAPAAANDVCISMSGSGGQVAGIQLDLKWDGNCMSADPGSGAAARCTAESSTGKDIRTTVKAGSTLKAIFFSMSDTSPIPDGNLFCCKFTKSSTAGVATRACCNLAVGNALGSDSVGTAISTDKFTLLASMDGQPCAATDVGGGSGSGQQRAPVRSGLQGGSGGVAPPVVSAPGGAPPAAVQQAPLGQAPAGQVPAGQVPAGQVPAAQVPAGQVPGRGGPLGGPAGGPPAAEPPTGMDQVQRALDLLAPHLAPTEAATAHPQAAATPQPTRASGTPTAKAKATEVHGTPTAAAKKTPSAATTRGPKTPKATPAATPKAE